MMPPAPLIQNIALGPSDPRILVIQLRRTSDFGSSTARTKSIVAPQMRALNARRGGD